MSQSHDLQRAVLAAITADAQLCTGHIGVSAQAGVVTLDGYVANCGQRDAACRATRRVGGVRVVISALFIALPSHPFISPA